jgi:phospholipase C
MRRRIRWVLPLSLAAVAAAAIASTQAGGATKRAASTRTPIQHLVVIFQENVSFDHYFGTYPTATNADGSPFTAAPGTPSVNGLPAVNPNSAAPRRLDSSPLGLAGSPGGQITCDQDHNYNDEQRAFDNGAMDKFVETVGTDGGTHRPGGGTTSGGPLCDPKIVMDYYDGNTTTAYWNYAQHYAMSDNSFSPTFGPSSPGAINLVSGDTGGVLAGQELQGVNLQGAFLYGTDLHGAKLQGVNLQGADLTNANLSGATLKGANTNRAVWSNTTCPDGTNSNADGGSCQGT